MLGAVPVSKLLMERWRMCSSTPPLCWLVCFNLAETAPGNHAEASAGARGQGVALGRRLLQGAVDLSARLQRRQSGPVSRDDA